MSRPLLDLLDVVDPSTLSEDELAQVISAAEAAEALILSYEEDYEDTPDSDGRYPLSEIARRLSRCAELAEALDRGCYWQWWGDEPRFAPIESAQDRENAIEYLASSIGAARVALLGRSAPPYID